MGGTAIFLPVAALAIWTFAILFLVPIARIGAARSGRVRAKDFRYGESANVPGDVSLPNRDYMNLLELPVLFYVVAIAVHVTGKSDALYVGLASAFVALRIAHSIVHLAYNNVLHRLVAFGLGAVCLLAMWIRFGVSLLIAG